MHNKRFSLLLRVAVGLAAAPALALGFVWFGGHDSSVAAPRQAAAPVTTSSTAVATGATGDPSLTLLCVPGQAALLVRVADGTITPVEATSGQLLQPACEGTPPDVVPSPVPSTSEPATPSLPQPDPALLDQALINRALFDATAPTASLPAPPVPSVRVTPTRPPETTTATTAATATTRPEARESGEHDSGEGPAGGGTEPDEDPGEADD